MTRVMVFEARPQRVEAIQWNGYIHPDMNQKEPTT